MKIKNKAFLKIVLILLAFSTSVFARDYFFYVETPEIADSYFNIFNGIAKIFHSNDYLDLLRLVFLFGGFFVFTSGVLQSWGREAKGAISSYAKYLIGGVALLSIIFAKDATIVVKSKTLPTYCSPGTSATAGFAVDNIPEVLAYAFSFTNAFGREMTKLAEVAYITPNANGTKSIEDSGGYIGALKSALNVLSTDANKISLSNSNSTGHPYDLGMVVRTVFSQCILIPFSSKGATGLDEITKLKSSNNIFGYLDNLYTTNPSIGGTLARDYQATLGGETWKCGNLYDNYLKQYINNFKDDVVCGVNVGAGAIQLITGQASPPKSDFQEVAIQAGLVGELANVSSQLGVGVSGMSYASGKTRAEFVQSNMANGEYMAQMLPYLQMTIRAVLYAFFPFVFVIVLLPGGLKVITQYMQTLIWVELWSPTAAILNMFITQQAEYKLSSDYSTNGLTLTNSIDMLSTGSTIAGVAGYLYMSVPALTWLIMKGSAYMLAGIGGAVAAGMSRNIQTDSINQDKALIAQNNEVRNQTGKEISIAEMQHYQAIQQGAIAGATLGTQMNLGLKNVKENEAYKVAKDVKSFLALKEATGSVNGESLANTEAAANAVDKGGKLKAVRETIQSSDGSYSLNEKGKTVVEQDSYKTGAEYEAKNQHQLSRDQHTYTELAKRQDYQGKGEVLYNRIKHDIANGVVMRDKNGNIDISRYINRFARTDGYLAAHKQEVAQITAQKLGMLGTDKNADGTPTVHYGTGANYANSEASVGARNTTSQIANDQELTRQGVSGTRQGIAQADATARTVGQTETIKHLAQQHYEKNMTGLGSIESQTLKVGNNETTYAADGTMIHNRQTNIGSHSAVGYEAYARNQKIANIHQYVTSIVPDVNTAITAGKNLTKGIKMAINASPLKKIAIGAIGFAAYNYNNPDFSNYMNSISDNVKNIVGSNFMNNFNGQNNQDTNNYGPRMEYAK